MRLIYVVRMRIFSSRLPVPRTINFSLPYFKWIAHKGFRKKAHKAFNLLRYNVIKFNYLNVHTAQLTAQTRVMKIKMKAKTRMTDISLIMIF